MTDPVVLEKAAKAGEQTLNQKIVTWIQGKMGQKVGDGECWTLAEQALQASGGYGSGHYGKITDDADYEWGTKIKLTEVKAGDILQFRDHVVRTLTKTSIRFEDQSGWDEEDDQSSTQAHHTAIVKTPADADGRMAVMDQNSDPGGKIVQNQVLYTRSVAEKTTKEVKSVYDEDAGKKRNATVITKVTITVTGKLWAYRPQVKPEETK